ncbi:MAG: translation elongation factor Ts [Candidatus Nanopelagicales bacterium]
MANITAADVKKLRDHTAAGMMECKKALEEADGDFDKAVEILRVSGAAKAAKRGAEREASNGLVANNGNALVELLCETDFVAKNEDFLALANAIAQAVVDAQINDTEGAKAAKLADGRTAGDAIAEMASVIGEKLEIGRVAVLPAPVSVYMHRRASDLPAQVGVMVAYSGSEDAARGAAMQIAAMRPQFLTRDEVPAETVETERRIAEATAKEEGKPEAALSKIIEGRVNSFFKDNVLLEQPSVVEQKKSVAQVLADAKTDVTAFVRFEIGQ